MKKLGLILLLGSTVAYSQISIAPIGSAGSQSSTPVGKKKTDGSCTSKNCIQFNVTPSCFGTNLRAYSAETQMKQEEDNLIKLKLTKGTNVDNIEIRYPASLTFGSSGVRQDCTIDSGQDLSNSSPKQITCTKPGSTGSFSYTLLNWKSEINPVCYANGGSHGLEYCNYAGVLLPASTSASGIDSNVSCLYKFKSNWKIDDGKVSCKFQSSQGNQAAQMNVKLNGVELTTEVDKQAFINRIDAKVSKSFNSIPSTSLIHHGVLKSIPTPDFSYEFFQVASDGTERKIANIVEESGFVAQAGNRTFNLVVKHPGVKGFCGGYYSPLMFFFDSETPEFNGVSLFPLYGVKKGSRVYWPEKNSKGYFLVDMKGKNTVADHDQLFGKDGLHENGFKALEVHDKNGDKVINSKDEIFSSLKLWNDKDGNGLSNSREIASLKEMGIVEIDLNYKSNNVTKYGNRARAKEKSTFSFSKDGKSKNGRILDVWLSEVEN